MAEAGRSTAKRHFIRQSSANARRILCTHASRNYPGSVYATISRAEGKTWDTANTRMITNDIKNYDSCYPNTGQMADGTLITTWYTNLFGKFYIPTFLWRPEDV